MNLTCVVIMRWGHLLEVESGRRIRDKPLGAVVSNGTAGHHVKSSASENLEVFMAVKQPT